MKLRTDSVSKQFQPLFYEKPVGVFPFAEMVQATRPYADGEMDGLLQAEHNERRERA